jgi:hypothetical protein
MKYFLSVLTLSVLMSCSNGTETNSEKPLARVFDKYLYAEDIKGVVSAGISSSDSASVVNDFIEKWIRNELLLNKAENNLTDAEKDVEKQIESYRSSLLIYAYQQRYLDEKLDTVVGIDEITRYYKDNQSNFVLGEPLMKGLFIKLPVKAPEVYRVRQWYRTDDPESIKKLEGYCFAHAKTFDHFRESWVNLNEVLRMMPSNGGINAGNIQYRKNVETRDNDYIYLLNIKEFAPEGTVSPFELVKNDIHNIILNKRKVKLINELETSIYSDAQNRDHFTIYK